MKMFIVAKLMDIICGISGPIQNAILTNISKNDKYWCTCVIEIVYKETWVTSNRDVQAMVVRA